ncbi:SigE family RNA polymerase sigma factor [Blastococcus sp. TF02-09]|uniref:sigma-70 family RNA polymerase sigma factor n=1 Tax=Blastococcus sp. TF02-09 TaxID=2250576 RepID=UPI000DEBC3AF|nr:sigma-70 family RNA polymerase sigma factor [Blastococcus sp. TF02-9]RBY76575.1 SigE family RNA polymerase sigma factor [Blastococcus sp. TF02-9]
MTPEESFAEFYAAWKDPCLRAVVASGTDRAVAEESVAEAFARAWASWPKVSRHPAPSAWVVRTALNHRVSRWRRTRREVALTSEVAARAAEHPTDHPERDDLLRAVAALPERQRQVVALRVFLDLDTRQTAQVLDLSPGTVSAHLHRALTTLRVTIAPDLEVCS